MDGVSKQKILELATWRSTIVTTNLAFGEWGQRVR